MKKRLVVWLLLLCFLLCCACSHREDEVKVPDYLDITTETEDEDVEQNLPDDENTSDEDDDTPADNPDTPDTPEVPDNPAEPKPEEPNEPEENERPNIPVLTDFTVIGSVYDWAIDFFGNYALATKNDTTVLLDVDGNETPWDKGTDYTFYQNRYLIEEDNGFKKLMDIDGTTVLEGVFESIEYDGSTILAKDGTYTHIYRNSERIGEPTVRQFQIIQDGWLRELFDDEDEPPACDYSYDLELNKRMLTTAYSVHGPAVEDITLIQNKNGLFGYAKDGAVAIKPKFILADNFVNGYALVSEIVDIELRNCLIDTAGNYLVQTTADLSQVHDGHYFIRNTTDGAETYILYDLSGNDITLPQGMIPYNMRVYGDYIIDTACHGIYSMTEKAYLPYRFTQIKPIGDGHFIIRDEEGKYSLLTSDFETVIDKQDEIGYANGIYKFASMGKVHFQKYIGENS